MPADIYDLATEYRASLLRKERKAAGLLLRQYGQIWVRLQDKIASLTSQIEAARNRGETVNEAWLFRQERFQAMLNQLSREIAKFASYADETITGEQREAVKSAVVHAAKLVAAQTPDDQASVTGGFDKLSTSAAEQLIGFTADGSPLKGLLDKLRPDAMNRVTTALVESVARGIGPKQTARAIRDSLDGNAARALTIARTETLRAYREASRATWQANSDVVGAWLWYSSRDPRECAVCWAMDGTIHELSEPLGSHPNCRCTQIPVTRDSEIVKRAGNGPAVFAQLSAETQRDVLGKSKYAAYFFGEIKLKDLVGFRRDPQWGPVRFERGLKDALTGEMDGAIPKPVQIAPLPPFAPPNIDPPKPAEPPALIPKPEPAKPIEPQPAGKPVSAALKLPKSGFVADSAKQSLEAIARVHGDGELPVIPIILDKSKEGEVREAGYWAAQYPDGTSKAEKITIGKFATFPELAIVHEIGHFLDQQGAGGGRFASQNDPRFQGWRDAVKNSQAWKDLEKIREQREAEGVSVEYVTYLQLTFELWARSYSQYVAIRSKDRDMADQLRVLRRRREGLYYPMQWDDDDFEPIAKEIDSLMLKLGWRK